MSLGYLFRKFELKLEGMEEEDKKWKDFFMPVYEGRQLHVVLKKREG